MSIWTVHKSGRACDNTYTMNSSKLSTPERPPLRQRIQDLEQQVKETRPFYWFMLLFMVVMYVAVVATDPAMRTPGRLVLFTLLMALHVVLHWISPYLASHRRWIVAYLVSQAPLITAIVITANNTGVILGLYLAMMGESTGLLERLRPIAIAVAAYFALMLLTAGLAWGWDGVTPIIGIAIPMSLFVVVYVYLYVQQANARERAQLLLTELEAAHTQLAEYSQQVNC